LALSANSPFFEGEPTGLASTRWDLFTGMPRTDVAPEFRDFAHLEAVYEKLLQAEDITAPGELWWMIRPQPPLGTLEFRIFDLPTDTRRIGLLAAVCQAACKTYQDRFDEARPATPIRREYLEENLWNAMRYSLDTHVIDPVDGEILSMRDQLKRLLDEIAPAAGELGTEEWMHQARLLVDQPTEADRQAMLAEEHGGDLRSLELELARLTLEGTPSGPAA